MNAVVTPEMSAEMDLYSPGQVAAAKALLATAGGVAEVKGMPGLFRVKGSKPRSFWVADRNGCNCPASGRCKHLLSVRVLLMAREQMRRAA